MAQHKSTIRQWRRSLRRNAINKQNKSSLRTQVKQVRAAIESKDKEGARKILPETYSLIDRAVKKGTIHKSKGDRIKSRLGRQAERIEAVPAK